MASAELFVDEELLEPTPDHPRSARAFLKRVLTSRAGLVGFVIVALYVFAATIGAQLVHDPSVGVITERLQGPSGAHWLGTDELGRDVFDRLVYGARVSIQIQLIGVVLASVPGVLWGLVSGYVRGWFDEVSMRVLDVMLAFPSILFAIAVVAVLGPGFFNVVVAIGLSSVPRFARLARGVVLELREREWVLAGRAIGESHASLMTRYIAPGLVSAITVEATVRMATLLLTAAGLSFLGLGVKPPTPEWGSMLSSARSYMFSAPHSTIAPGLAITIVVIGFNLLGDAVRDARDPRR
jgi:peptide/nickel transport system permease protein